MKNFEKKVKNLIKSKKMSVEEFAIKVGMTKQNFYLILKREDLNVSYLEKMAIILDVPIGYFFDDLELKELPKPVAVENPPSSINQDPEYWRKKYLREKKDKLFFRGLLEK